jgi:uncharacterized protein YceK
MKKVLSVLVALLLQGCASITVHEGVFISCATNEDPREDSPTPVLGGTVTDVRTIGECIAAPVIAIWSDSVDWWEIFLLPLPVLDLPLSLVADMIYTPSDIFYWPDWKRTRAEEASVAAPIKDTAGSARE